MSSTALGAERAIIFISEAHEKFYYEKLKEVRYQNVYHKALVYCLGISDDTRRNIKSIYDFKTGSIKTKCLHEGWQTSGSVKVVRMAFNLYCKVRQRKGRLDLTIVSGKHLRKISDRTALQSADNAEKFITTRKIDSFESLAKRVRQYQPREVKDRHRVSLCRGNQL